MDFGAPVGLLGAIGNPFEWPGVHTVGLDGLRVPEFPLLVFILQALA